jgi:hypothetical protein
MKASVVMILVGLIVISVAVQAQGPPACAAERGAGSDAEACQREARPDRLLAGGRRRSSRVRWRYVPAVHSVPVEELHGVDQSERGLGVHVRNAARSASAPVQAEHWDKIIELDQWTNKYDPVMTCLPLGIPRQGPPSRIFHTGTTSR